MQAKRKIRKMVKKVDYMKMHKHGTVLMIVGAFICICSGHAMMHVKKKNEK